LGAPGSGKTTTQLELAQELIKRAEEQPDYPVPVLFNLSSWKDDRQSLTDWLVAELKSKYGVSVKLGKEWVNNRQLLPLLDGLDELEPQRQEICVHEINQLLLGENRPFHVVVCSRIEEYSNYATQLQLNGAIYLQPLTNNQICDYLTSINYIELWSSISRDLDLLELVKTPLLLSITLLASKEISVEEWRHLASTADRLQYLLDTYIGRMLTRNINSRAYLKNKTPNTRKTRMWLVWLAQQMQQESKTEFLIEEMQPYWLKSKSQNDVYYLILWIIIGGLLFGLIAGLIVGLIREPIVGIIAGLIVALIVWLILGMSAGLVLGLTGRIEGSMDGITDRINTVEILKFSFNKFFDRLGYELSRLVRMGVYPITYVLVYGQLVWLIYGLLVWLICVLIYGLIDGISGVEIENKYFPNQGIWQSVINALILFLITSLFFTTLCFLILLMTQPDKELNKYFIYSVTFGLFFGIFIGILKCGTPAIKHSVLRVILWTNGYIPWNYARFLDYCTDRLFLQRVGGRYRFIHKLLQDHFAQMPFDRIVD
jgi:hypothetical protein